MPHSYTCVYVHFVWATWNRMPLLTAALETAVYACIANECRALRCEPLAIGGTADHVHVLVRLHSTAAISAVVKAMKGTSSHLVTHVLAPGQEFKWQGTYGAFSVSPGDVEQIRAYVNGQEEHHARAALRPEWERCMEIEGAEEPNWPPH